MKKAKNFLLAGAFMLAGVAMSSTSAFAGDPIEDLCTGGSDTCATTYKFKDGVLVSITTHLWTETPQIQQ